MTDPRRQRFAPYVRRLADMMGLKDWGIKIRDENPSDSTALASVTCTYGQKQAQIRITADFLVDTADQQRYVLVHELVHCHLDLPGNIAEDELSEASKRNYRRTAEMAVDAIARSWAVSLPLPNAEEQKTESLLSCNGRHGIEAIPEAIP